MTLSSSTATSGTLTVTIYYEPGNLERLRFEIEDTDAAASYVNVDRRSGGATTTPLRGAVELPLVAGVAEILEYEYVGDGSTNEYVVTTYDSSDVQVSTLDIDFVVNLAKTYIRSVLRPFLSVAVTVRELSAIERPARVGILPVKGRTLPVAITEVGGSRRLTLEVYSTDATVTESLDYVAASGDILLVQPPAACPVPHVYCVLAGSAVTSRPVRVTDSRMIELPLVEVAPPPATVAPTSVTYQGVLDTYATYQDLLDTGLTYAELAAQLSAPSEVIVP